MKTISIFTVAVAALCLCSCNNSEKAAYKPLPKKAEITQYEGMKLVWNDEFNVDGKLSDECA